MGKPPYLTKMLLNPIEGLIQHNEELTLPQQEDSLIISTSPEDNSFNNHRILVPKKHLTKVLWFTVSLAAAHSCFSFTLSIPKLQHYYKSNVITISAAFWVLPLMAGVVVPIFAGLLEKTNSLLPLMMSAFANALGCAIKCTGTEQNGYPIIIAGQLINILALPASLGYLFVFSKQYPTQKWPIASSWITSIALGSISGMCLLPLLLAGDEKPKDIGLQIYKYLLWSAFVSIIPLVLIPFVMKEQKQFSGTTYQVFSANNETVNAGENQHEQSDISLLASKLRSFKFNLSKFRERRFLLTASASGTSFGLLLHMFAASAFCIEIEAKIIWKLCIVESTVVLTFALYFFVLFVGKIDIPRWLVVGNNVLLISSAIIFNLCKEFMPSSVQIFLIYALHAVSGLNCFVLMKRSLLNVSSLTIILAMIFAQGLFSTLACFILFVLLWRFSMMVWTTAFCALSVTSSLSLFVSS